MSPFICRKPIRKAIAPTPAAFAAGQNGFRLHPQKTRNRGRISADAAQFRE
jgi:hypothetical protein